MRRNTRLLSNSHNSGVAEVRPWDDPVILKQCHRTNRYDDYIERKDSLFWLVTMLFYEKPSEFKSLLKRAPASKEPDEVWSALTGYLHYVNGDYRFARDCFLRAVALNPDNLDNWFDLTFALRHLSEYECSDAILFHYGLVRHYYMKITPHENKWASVKKLLM